jgi:hypothetical protein
MKHNHLVVVPNFVTPQKKSHLPLYKAKSWAFNWSASTPTGLTAFFEHQ